jgi:hypothetical protein
MARYPSRLISCSHALLLGEVATSVGKAGEMKANLSLGRDVDAKRPSTSVAMGQETDSWLLSAPC